MQNFLCYSVIYFENLIANAVFKPPEIASIHMQRNLDLRLTQA